ncbi:hypothetical protein [Rhodococcus opacus]|uniref:hypothetical protein n=1 Tax=Rhodococcus opacus TaxID=37919 RepID=UPI0022358E83|nr:hypothetical protein [Rhodococcus opacus]UZG58007.1 hypothetical protein ONE62_12170 [Rhodococcus opacus]
MTPMQVRQLPLLPKLTDVARLEGVPRQTIYGRVRRGDFPYTVMEVSSLRHVSILEILDRSGIDPAPVLDRVNALPESMTAKQTAEVLNVRCKRVWQYLPGRVHRSTVRYAREDLIALLRSHSLAAA